MRRRLWALTSAITAATVAMMLTVPSGTAQARHVRGDRGPDRLVGGAAPDVLAGRAGNDKVSGRAGNDHVSGGSGNDRVSGGSGSDELDGGDGQDRLDAGPGNDHITGDAGNDVIRPGPGADRVYAEEGSRNRVVATDDGVRDDIWCVRGGSGDLGLVIYVGGRDRRDTLHGCRVRIV